MFGIKKPSTGGGQTYIELSGIEPEEIEDFCKYGIALPSPFSDENKEIFKIETTALCPEDYPTDDLEIKPRHHRKGYVISNQTIANRHPAWDKYNDFPDVKNEVEASSLSKKCLIFIIRTSSKKYYAGFRIGTEYPANWPSNSKLHTLFKNDCNIGIISLANEDGICLGIDNDNPFIHSETQTINEIPNTVAPETPNSDEPVISEDINDFDSLKKLIIEKVEAPSEIKAPSSRTDSTPGVHPNYKKAQEVKKKIGDAGELIALQFEKNRLHSIGLDTFIPKIEHVSITQGDGLGYDIKSFDKSPDGTVKEIFIEVKSTIGNKEDPFQISSNEVSVSKKLGDSYKIYRLFKIKNKTRVYLYIVSGSVEDNFKLKPTDFFAYKGS
jgi:hypothetical protein